jgi:hypothetical protein
LTFEIATKSHLCPSFDQLLSSLLGIEPRKMTSF